MHKNALVSQKIKKHEHLHLREHFFNLASLSSLPQTPHVLLTSLDATSSGSEIDKLDIDGLAQCLSYYKNHWKILTSFCSLLVQGLICHC